MFLHHSLRIPPIPKHQRLLSHITLRLRHCGPNQMMMRAFIAHGVGIGRIASEHKRVAAAAAEILGFFRAVETVAVPVGKAAASGGAENADFHGEGRLCAAPEPGALGGLAVAEVQGDFKTDTQIFKSRFGPHNQSSPGYWDFGVQRAYSV